MPELASSPSKDMTQRIQLEDTAHTAPRSTGSRPANPQRNRNKKRWFMTRKEKITLITLASITAILLIAAIIMISTMFSTPEDDGRIMKGVIAAGVNLGGMTPEEATAALEEATANTYTKLDMVVTVLNTQIKLSPQNTGAQLDVEAVVQAAYDYGRTGSRAERNQAKNNALANSVIIPITPYLNLNTEYIKSEIDKLGVQYSSTLTPSKLSPVEGEKPTLDVTAPDTSQVHQTFTIYMGTAEYILDTNKLYEQVLEYYNINIFQVVGTCKVEAPESVEAELQQYYDDLCTPPQNAVDNDGEIEPEKYGYGFDLDLVKEQIAQAEYGETIVVELRYLKPDLTAELISSTQYKDILGSYSSTLGAETAWNSNATLACNKLNGLILKPGDTFSFNELLGELTAQNGYLEALAYRGKVPMMVMGGGVTHTASVLYNCVLEAELEILERHNHTYAVSFIETGRDVYVDGSTADFSFKNSLPDPIRIKAEVVNGQIQIRIEGTDNRDYNVNIEVKFNQTITPGKLYNIMSVNNPGGYIDGQVLTPGMIGYEVEIRAITTNKATGETFEQFVSTYTYEAKDAVVVRLQDPAGSTPTDPPVDPDPSEPGTDTTLPGTDTTEPGTDTTEPATGPA